MIYKIYYDGKYEDNIQIEAETIEELREIAKRECDYRGWEEDNCSSCKISD